jgi:hypothetical protein
MPNWIRRRQRDQHGFWHPGVLLCECGAHVVIEHDGVECDACGQQYNLFGQRLMRNWESEADDYRNEG